MLIKFVLALIALVGVVFLYAYIRAPSVLKISRTIQIPAPAEAVFPYLNTPKLMQEWNPFTEGDPSLQIVYSGPAEGIEASYQWEGKKAGAGKATIVEVDPNRRVAMRLDFVRPFRATNFGDYVLTPKEGSTEVTWTINETSSVPRLLSTFINLDQKIGGEFEKGLLKLKGIVASNT